MKPQEAITLPIADVSNSEAAGQALAEAAKRIPSIWVVTADVMRSTKVEPFVLAFPNRYINVGLAEQTSIGVAAGLATCGKIPFVAIYAGLASMRACEQVRNDIAYTNLNVKIFATHAGLSLGKGGTTHHATEDIAIMRAIANMTVIVPSDIYEAREAIFASIAKPGPVYIRLRRGPDPIVYTEELDYKIGRANVLRQGSDVTLIACGRSVAESIVAAELLLAEGISSCVLDMHTIKPIDVSAIEEAATHTRMVFTIEQHNIIGGLGGAVAEVMANLGSSTPLRRLGLPDIYAGIGPREQLIDKHGLTGPKIADEVLSTIG